MSAIHEMLSRYRDVVDDFDALVTAAARPIPRTLWGNPLRGDPADLDGIVAANAPGATRVPWRPHSWRIDPDAMPGRWPDFMLGRFHVQEEAAMWAGDVLDAQPGERIADLCAAPGGKTAQMAAAMGDVGMVVAGERRFDRLAALRRTLDRLGVTCALIAHQDGLQFPFLAGGYDRVLVDAPCTGEGTVRKTVGAWRPDQTERYRTSIVQVQKGLLRRALKLVRPGGVVVYSTCTFAPEENEAVLSAVDPSLATLEPVVTPANLRTSPALTEWRGQSFRPDITHAARLWPHHNNTGGFFAAKLRRTGGPPPIGDTTPPRFEPLPAADYEALLAWLERRWGFPRDAFAEQRLWHRPGNHPIWIAAKGCVPPTGLDPDTIGTQLTRRPPPKGKPSSAFFQKFGHLATRNIVVVDDAQARLFLRREHQPFPPGHAKGYCVVKHAGRVIGCGMWHQGELRSELPKGWILGA